MTEERFTYENLLEVDMIFDAKTERGYYFNGEICDKEDVKLLVDLLNKQEARIKELERKLECCEYEQFQKKVMYPISVH